MPLKPAYNTTDRPVVIDDDGHTLGGREWGAVDPGADRVAELVAGGDLVVKDQLPESADPAIRAAVEAAQGRTPAATATEPAGEGTADPNESPSPPADPDPKPKGHR